jgi:hypothetical protein
MMDKGGDSPRAITAVTKQRVRKQTVMDLAAGETERGEDVKYGEQ